MAVRYQLLLLILVCACSRADNVVQPLQFKSTPANKVQLIIYRPSSLMFMRTPTVAIGAIECSLGIKNYAQVDVEPGLTTLQSESWDGGEASLSLRLDKGKRYYIRVDSERTDITLGSELADHIVRTSNSGDWFSIDLTEAELAEQEMASAIEIACEPIS